MILRMPAPERGSGGGAADVQTAENALRLRRCVPVRGVLRDAGMYVAKT